MTVKVAILQKKSLNRQFQKSTDCILESMEEAAENGTDILLLPEAFITGYELPMSNEEALEDGSLCLQRICDAARRLRLGVVATAITKGAKKPRNSAYVVDKNGTVLMKYSKVHTCDFADEACLESGDAFHVCDFHGIKLGIMICYDREYPESARVLMLKGAELILVPNDCGAMKPRLCALSTRAYENMVGIAMANPNGENAGNSCAFSPICWDENGECVDHVLLMADDLTEGLFYAEFDMDAIRAYREQEMMGNTFRKVKAYDALLSGEVEYPFIRARQDAGKNSIDYSAQNKKAWEYNAYDFWVREAGAPAERAKKIAADPVGALKRYAAYFDSYKGVRIANICGSCGKKAVPLALLGAEVTVFDISADNQRYALELAEAAGTALDYQVCDVLQIDMAHYAGSFDVVFMEGGVLHYFHDIQPFMGILYALLKPGGKMICSDFHPFTKVMDTLHLDQPTMSYFSTEVFEGEMAHARFYPEEIRGQFPKCSYRKYTVSEIINGVTGAGFVLRGFDEHPAWNNPDYPGEFTLIADKK